MNGDNTAAWAWLIYGGYILLGWIPIDLWLHANKHPYLTTQMRAWWHSPRTGPFIIGGLAFVVVAFLDHIVSAGPHP